MNADLEKTLSELGPGYREVVNRLIDAYRPPSSMTRPSASRRWSNWFTRRQSGLLVAASLLVAIGIAVVLRPSAPQTHVYTVRATNAAREYRLADLRNDEAVKELIRTQRPDGGWSTAFLTKRNAEALRTVQTAEARIAYKKAIHNLRCRSL